MHPRATVDRARRLSQQGLIDREGVADHGRTASHHPEMAHRYPSRPWQSTQGTRAGLSALYWKATRRARVLISPRPVPGRRMAHARAEGRLRAEHRVLRRLAWSAGGRKECDVGGYARVQGLRRPENRHDRGQEHLKALDVPVSTARGRGRSTPAGSSSPSGSGRLWSGIRGISPEG
jgi:hypothetical protein